MMRYPGVNSNLYREQLNNYRHLQRKIAEARIKKSPYRPIK